MSFKDNTPVSHVIDEEDDDEEEDEEDEVDDNEDGGTKKAWKKPQVLQDPVGDVDIDDLILRHSMDRPPGNAHADIEPTMKEYFFNTMVENGPHGLGIVDAVHLAFILEELGDQLDVIGHSIDTPSVDLRTHPSIDHDLATHRPVMTIPATIDPYSSSLFKEKYILRQHYETVVARRIRQMGDLSPSERFRRKLAVILRTYGISKMSQKGKTQADRTWINIVLDDVVTELVQSHTFNSLENALEEEKEKHNGMIEKIRKSFKDEQHMKDIKKAIKKTEVARRKARKEQTKMMWQVEDNTQEMRRRKELEILLVQKQGAAMTWCSKKKCNKEEDEDARTLKYYTTRQIALQRAHSSMMKTIGTKYQEAQQRLEYWMEKYESDREALQISLETLKANRERDLARIEWLKFTIKNYSTIVMDDRRMKKIVADKAAEDALRWKKSIKMQAWWRGEMVRKRLGRFKPPKPAKEKPAPKKK